MNGLKMKTFKMKRFMMKRFTIMSLAMKHVRIGAPE